MDYLEEQLKARGLTAVAGATGGVADPTALAWRFSPRSNRKPIARNDELRVVVATDVLSEGQNLQDCAVIVNYDLPWAIIRLIQRAGRVDRIGQGAERILCYSFLPAEGIEQIINLRGRVRQRLRENADVVGADETFFEDDGDDRPILDLYHEKAGVLDGEADDATEVDLASYAYQIWKNATDNDPALKKTVENLPDVVFGTRAHAPADVGPPGVLVYLRTPDGNDALAWVDEHGRSITESQLAILRAAAYEPDTPALPRQEKHHDLVRQGVEQILAEDSSIGGQLGRPTGARFRTYERLKTFADRERGKLWAPADLHRAIDDIYRYPLRQSAVDTLNRQLKAGITDDALANLVVAMRQEDRLSVIEDAEPVREPRIICSLGLSPTSVGTA